MKPEVHPRRDLEETSREDHDIPVDMIVTEKRVIRYYNIGK